jgi:hypothetical protein
VDLGAKLKENNMNKNTLTLINGNQRPYKIGLPKLFILGKMNDVALAHVHENTGLSFVANHNGLEAQPENGNQIAALLLTYDFKTRYYNNASVRNTLFLKSDHHTGFNVDSICLDCVKHNHIHAGGLEQGDRLAC